MDLYVSAGKHIHLDSEQRRSEVKQALDGEPEVVFVEGRTEPNNRREKLRNFLAAPLLLLGLFAWGLFLKILRIPFGSDQELTEKIANSPDVDKIKADRALTPMISGAWKLWAITNWFPIGVFLLIYSSAGILTSAMIVGIFAAVIFINFIAATSAPRNYAIAMNVMRAVKKENYDRGVLVVGKDHSEAVKRHITETSDTIEIVEP